MQIERVIINFADTCNMQCPFCYIPFDGKQAEFSVLEKIIDRCEELKVRIVTFGGGDPFIYPQFRKIIPIVREKGFFVHIDTNTLSVTDQDIDLIKKNVNLLGVPLDGSTEEIQQRMRRSHRNNFTSVLRVVGLLENSPVQTKVNTVATAINHDDIPQIAELVSSLPVDRWSLYQFWPNAVPQTAVEEYQLDDHSYDRVVENVRERLQSIGSPVKFEAGRLSDRRSTYIFVKPNKDADTYVADPTDHRKNIHPGSFFDVTAQQMGELLLGTTVRDTVRSRYYTL